MRICQINSQHTLYRQTSNISRTKSQTIKFSRLILQMFLPNPLKTGVTSRMKVQLEKRRQTNLQLDLSNQ